ncbi:zinc finger, CCHC-type containing protein [Tanacetum coccineum]
MGDENPIRTLGDYSRPSHEGCENTIKLPDGNNVVPLRSDTIRLVQNGCSFHRLRSEDPNQHLKDFLKLVDSLDLDVVNMERTRLLLVREEARHLITKHVNAISIVKMEKEKSVENNVVIDKNVVESSELDVVEPIELVDMKEGMEDEMDDESDESMKEELTKWETKAEVLVEMPRSQPIGYYLKHEINEKLIEGLVDNHKYNDSLLSTCLGKMDYKTYNSLPVGPMYNVILKKTLAKKDDMEGNFVIPCSIVRLTNEKLEGTDIRLSLASHSYIYLFRITEDVLIDIVGYVYPVDFVILNIKEDENKPFILGTPFLTTAKAEIRFDMGTITLKSGKNKINFFKIPEFPCKIENKPKENIDSIKPTNIMSRRILE